MLLQGSSATKVMLRGTLWPATRAARNDRRPSASIDRDQANSQPPMTRTADGRIAQSGPDPAPLTRRSLSWSSIGCCILGSVSGVADVCRVCSPEGAAGTFAAGTCTQCLRPVCAAHLVVTAATRPAADWHVDSVDAVMADGSQPYFTIEADRNAAVLGLARAFAPVRSANPSHPDPAEVVDLYYWFRSTVAPTFRDAWAHGSSVCLQCRNANADRTLAEIGRTLEAHRASVRDRTDPAAVSAAGRVPTLAIGMDVWSGSYRQLISLTPATLEVFDLTVKISGAFRQRATVTAVKVAAVRLVERCVPVWTTVHQMEWSDERLNHVDVVVADGGSMYRLTQVDRSLRPGVHRVVAPVGTMFEADGIQRRAAGTVWVGLASPHKLWQLGNQVDAAQHGHAAAGLARQLTS